MSTREISSTLNFIITLLNDVKYQAIKSNSAYLMIVDIIAARYSNTNIILYRTTKHRSKPNESCRWYDFTFLYFTVCCTVRTSMYVVPYVLHCMSYRTYCTVCCIVHTLYCMYVKFLISFYMMLKHPIKLFCLFALSCLPKLIVHFAGSTQISGGKKLKNSSTCSWISLWIFLVVGDDVEEREIYVEERRCWREKMLRREDVEERKKMS